MLLAIDVGNTQTVIGLYDLEPDDEHNVDRRLADTHLLDHWRVATNAERTADEHALVMQEFLGFHGFSFDDDIAGIVLCSSVPRVTGAIRRMSERYFGHEPVVIEPGIRTGMPILYDNPKEVGADRIADAVAAFDLYGGPIVVVDFGTATTFEADLGQGRVPGRRHLPRHRHQPRRPVRPGRGPAPGRAGRAPPRHRPVDGRVDAVGRHLRLHVAGRRHGRPHRGRAGREGLRRLHRRAVGA